MDKALPICLCVIMLISAGIIGLTSFSSQAQTSAGGIIIEDADYVSNKTTEYSADLINIAKNVTPRIVVEYGDSVSTLGLHKSDDLNQVASAVSSRIIVEYADSISEHVLESVTVPDITPRITVEYADSIFSTDLERPLFGEVSARIDSYSISPRNVTVGDDVTIGFSFTNTGDLYWKFGAGATLRKPDGTQIDLLEEVTVNPGELGSTQWTYTIDVAGRWDTVFGVWKEYTHPLESLLVQTGWVDEYITATAIETEPPVASFTYNPTEPLVGEEVTFDASASYDIDGEIIFYMWNFGDETITTITDPVTTHTYMATDAYTVTLTVTDDNGATESTSKIIDVITIVPNQPPVALFEYTPQNPKAGKDVILDASKSFDPDGEIKFYKWDLDGDGNYDGLTTSPEIFYYWDESDTYSVKLTVIDNDGARGTTVKDIKIEGTPWWEDIKNFFSSSVRKLSKEERKRFEIIKSELRISNYPHSDKPWSDPDFYWTSDNELLTVLKKKIELETSDLTYEMLIINILHDMKLADSIAGRPWSAGLNIQDYFENMAEINAWAEVGLLISEVAFEGIIEAAGGTAIGVGPILMLPKIFQATYGLKLLDELFYQRALWHYFQLRQGDDSPQEAFGSSPIPAKYCNTETKEYFESLWKEYGDHISDRGGLKQDFKEKVIKQLRAILLSGLEKFEFYPYQIYRLNSPGEIRVYDTQGRITGLVNGEIREEIPDSAYDNETKTVLIFSSTDSYQCKIIGTQEGQYRLEVNSIEDGEATTFTAHNISIIKQAIHQYTIDWAALSLGEEGVTVEVDSDGDGTFEKTFTVDSELTQDEFMLQVPPVEAFPLWTVGVAVAAIAMVTTAMAVFWRKRKQPPTRP